MRIEYEARLQEKIKQDRLKEEQQLKEKQEVVSSLDDLSIMDWKLSPLKNDYRAGSEPPN